MEVKDYSFTEMVEMLQNEPGVKFETTRFENKIIAMLRGSIYFIDKRVNVDSIIVNLSLDNLTDRYTLIEEPLPQLSEEARTMLRLIDPSYKWIGKDQFNDGSTTVFEKEPVLKNGILFPTGGYVFNLRIFNHLFADLPTDKPYLIADLIGEKVKTRLDVLAEAFIIYTRCPSDVDIDPNTKTIIDSVVTGCRGITCTECWNKPAE